MTGEPLTQAQRRVLRTLAAGGKVLAAMKASNDFERYGVVFSEGVGIMVRNQSGPSYRVRSKTLQRLYFDGLIGHPADDGGGLREFRITDAGRSALAPSLTVTRS